MQLQLLLLSAAAAAIRPHQKLPRSVVEEIRAMGGRASANYDDVSDWAGAENMINQTVEEFGDITVLICK